jgi:excisionase family DNA binding protein
MPDDGLFLTISEAAKKLNVNPMTIRRRIQKGEITAQLLPKTTGGQHWLIPVSELEPHADIAPVPQLPAAVVLQITEAVRTGNEQAVQAAVLPMQQQLEAQAAEIAALKQAIDNLTETQKKAAQEAAERDRRSFWARLIGR